MSKGDGYSGLTSPTTGRRVLEKGNVFVGNANNIEEPHLMSDGVFPLGKDNIWVGDKNCVAQESDILKDFISRLITLRYELSLIEQNATFILQKAHPLLPQAQALNLLPNGVLKHKDGVVNIATLSQGQVYVGDTNNEPVSTQTISRDNLPNLTWTRIWRGNLLSRPVESDDLTTLEGKVTVLESLVSALEAQVAAIESEIAAITAQIAEIITEQLLQQAEIVALQTQVAALEFAVAALQAQVAALGAALAALEAEVAALGFTVALHSATLFGIGISIASLNSSIDSINNRLNTIESAPINVIGDVLGTGTLFTPIVTVFKPDPVFTGKAMTIPSGASSQRPTVLIAGMVRYNSTPFEI